VVIDWYKIGVTAFFVLFFIWAGIHADRQRIKNEKDGRK